MVQGARYVGRGSDVKLSEGCFPKSHISDADTDLSHLIAVLERGEEAEIVLVRNGRPVAKLVLERTQCEKRISVAKGEFEVPDDIDADNAYITRLFSR